MLEANGKTTSLRLIQPDDAEFVYSLRIDPRYNQHLSPVTGTADDQRRWIENYKQREIAGQEFYFIIIRNNDNTPIGTVRLYDFIGERDSFCWGSWILNENKTLYSAIESAMLVYKIAFEQLKFKASHFDVRKGNTKVISFHEKMGARKTHEDELNIYLNLSNTDYQPFLKKNQAKINE